MAIDDLGSIGRRIEALGGELEDGREHRQAPIVGPSQQALLEQRPDGLEIAVTHGFDCVEREPAGEDPQLVEQASVIVGQQVVAPRDGRAKRLLSFGSIPAAARQDRQGTLEPGEQLVRAAGCVSERQRARSRAEDRQGGGRSRRPPQRARSRRRVPGRARPRPRPGAAGPRTRVRRSIRSGALDVVSTTQVRAGRDERRKERRDVRQQLLEIVEQDQHPPFVDLLGEPVLGVDRPRSSAR